MSPVVITNGGLYEIVKKRKLLTIQETGEEDGKKIEEYVDNLLFYFQFSEKFFELFDKTFCEETDEIEFDSEDGVVNDLINKIVLKIKEKLNSEKVTSGAGLNLLRLLLVFVEQFLRKDKSDSADKSSPAAETSQH